MLVLSRKRHQTIVIGDGPSQVVVSVIRIRGGTVKLGVDAAREIKVLRGEIVRREAMRGKQ